MASPAHASWAFLYVAQPQVTCAYPLKRVGAGLYLSTTVTPAPRLNIPAHVVMHDIDTFREDDMVDGSDMHINSVAFFHFDPKTLGKDGKRELFRKALTKDKTFWAAYPKSRAKETAVYMDGVFIVAVSAAHEGAGGCEIWINCTTVVGLVDDAKLRVVDQNVSMLLAHPRRLLVWVKAAAFSSFGLCMHAPDISKGKEYAHAWWTETYEILHKLIPRGATIVCCVDGNLRVRCSAEPWVGQLRDPPGTSGTDEAYILKLARQLQFSVVNTHEHNMATQSSHGTYRAHGALDAVRCDYFICSHLTWALRQDHVLLTTRLTNMPKRMIASRCGSMLRFLEGLVDLSQREGSCHILDSRYKKIQSLVAFNLMIAALESLIDLMRCHLCRRRWIIAHTPLFTIKLLSTSLWKSIRRMKNPKVPWMTDATFALCTSRSKMSDSLCRVGRQLSNAVVWFVFKTLAANAVICKQPVWLVVRRPAAKHLCMKQFECRIKVRELAADVDRAIAQDFANINVIYLCSVPHGKIHGMERMH